MNPLNLTHRRFTARPARRLAGRALFAAGLLAAVGLARAEGLYAGGSLAAPDWRSDVAGIHSDGGGLAGKAFVGYGFGPHFALEAGVFDGGHTEDASGRAHLRGVYADAVGSLELAPQWSLLGRAGLAQGRFTGVAGDDSSPALKLGAGLQYALTPRVGLLAEYEHYHFTDAFDAKPNIGAYSLGVKIGF